MTTLATILTKQVDKFELGLTTTQIYELAQAVEQAVLEAQRGGFRISLTEMHYLLRPFELYRTKGTESPIYDQLRQELALGSPPRPEIIDKCPDCGHEWSSHNYDMRLPDGMRGCWGRFNRYRGYTDACNCANRPPRAVWTAHLKIGDKVEAVQDACFSWNENVKKGDRFTIINHKDLETLGLLGLQLPKYYKKVENA